MKGGWAKSDERSSTSITDAASFLTMRTAHTVRRFGVFGQKRDASSAKADMFTRANECVEHAEALCRWTCCEYSSLFVSSFADRQAVSAILPHSSRLLGLLRMYTGRGELIRLHQAWMCEGQPDLRKAEKLFGCVRADAVEGEHESSACDTSYP